MYILLNGYIHMPLFPLSDCSVFPWQVFRPQEIPRFVVLFRTAEKGLSDVLCKKKDTWLIIMFSLQFLA